MSARRKVQWLGALLAVHALRVTDPAVAAGPDTAGTALVEWAYDTWTVPWVQVRGTSRALDPASHATLMTLVCETSVLERDRRVRHLSAEECEHRMAAIRADQDTALIFRVDLRVLDRSGASEMVRMGPRVKAVLEASDGWQWSPVDVRRGFSLGMATGQKPKRVPLYHPQWMRGSGYVHGPQYEPTGGRDVTIVEHWVRSPRRDPRTGEPVLTTPTRWLRLRLSHAGNEWVATWPFQPKEGRIP